MKIFFLNAHSLSYSKWNCRILDLRYCKLIHNTTFQKYLLNRIIFRRDVSPQQANTSNASQCMALYVFLWGYISTLKMQF